MFQKMFAALLAIYVLQLGVPVTGSQLGDYLLPPLRRNVRNATQMRLADSEAEVDKVLPVDGI